MILIDIVNSYPNQFVINIVGEPTEEQVNDIILEGVGEFVEQNDIHAGIWLYYILKSWDRGYVRIEPDTFITEHIYTIDTNLEIVNDKLESFIETI